MSIKEEIKNLKEAFDKLFETLETEGPVKPKFNSKFGNLAVKHRGEHPTANRYIHNRVVAKPKSKVEKAKQEYRMIDKQGRHIDKLVKKENQELKGLEKAGYDVDYGITDNMIDASNFNAGRKIYLDKLKKARAEEGKGSVASRAHESFQSQIDSLIESYTALLEAGVETESTGNEKEVSPNKIRKTKKDKNGNKVEVLSVEDELFPNEGNAKQQYNQKIINKINDMIEGTATLQDLLNLVRQKKVAPIK